MITVRIEISDELLRSLLPKARPGYAALCLVQTVENLLCSHGDGHMSISRVEILSRVSIVVSRYEVIFVDIAINEDEPWGDSVRKAVSTGITTDLREALRKADKLAAGVVVQINQKRSPDLMQSGPFLGY